MENLVGYAKTDLMIPGVDGSGTPFDDVGAANAAATAWCVEVNAAVHAEIAAVPAERLVTERELLAPLPSLRASIGATLARKVDRLGCVRFGSARYSVPVRFTWPPAGTAAWPVTGSCWFADNGLPTPCSRCWRSPSRSWVGSTRWCAAVGLKARVGDPPR